MEQDQRKLEARSSNEQLKLTALINRFCKREPEEFNPDLHLEEAREIIKALEPRIETSSNNTMHVASKMHLPNSESTAIGSTEFGEIKTTINNKDGKTKKFQKRVKGKQNIYRIGAYAVEKHTFDGSQSGILWFKDFWNYGGSNEALERYPAYWEIEYDLKSLELKSISWLSATLTKKEINFLIVQFSSKTVEYLPRMIWEAKVNN